MFVQVIQGRVKDPEGLRTQFEKWEANLKDGSIGYLGSTGGVADDGEFFMAARFESEEEARKNSDRTEQGQWWEETAGYFEGEPSFIDYTDAQLSRNGGSDDAGFVQVIQGRVKDIDKAKEMDAKWETTAGDMRPDLIGGVNCWKEDGSFTSINYFTSEAEARKGEAEEIPPEAKELFEEWMSLMEQPRYIDLKDPWYMSK